MDSMKKAQEIAKQAEVVNKELMETKVVGNDPSMQVYATFNGLGIPIGMKVSDAILAQGAEAVSLACTQAMADGHTKSQAVMMQRMQALYSGVAPPQK
jgi:DNA-binding protein YbaB